MSTRRMARSWVVALVILCALVPENNANAQSDDTTAFIIVLGPSELAIMPVGIIAAIGNLSCVADGERSSIGWQITGYAAGGVNLVAGIVWLFLYKSDKDISYGLGFSSLAIGAMDIGFTIWAASQPERSEQKITLAPIIMPDALGNAAFGVGLRLVDW